MTIVTLVTGLWWADPPMACARCRGDVDRALDRLRLAREGEEGSALGRPRRRCGPSVVRDRVRLRPDAECSSPGHRTIHGSCHSPYPAMSVVAASGPQEP